MSCRVLLQVGRFPSWEVWGEWNGMYRDVVRRFLKGDTGGWVALLAGGLVGGLAGWTDGQTYAWFALFMVGACLWLGHQFMQGCR